jgi:hypothetical protein
MAGPFLFVPLGSGGALGCAGGTGEISRDWGRLGDPIDSEEEGWLLSLFQVLDVGSH